MFVKAVRLYEMIHGRMSEHHVADFGPMCKLLENTNFANVIDNIKVLRREFTENFARYSQTALNLRTVPFTEAEIQAVQLLSHYAACWVSPNVFICEHEGVLKKNIVGEDMDFELVEGEVWVKAVPPYLKFIPDFDPKLGMTERDFFYKHILFGRVQ